MPSPYEVFYEQFTKAVELAGDIENPKPRQKNTGLRVNHSGASTIIREIVYITPKRAGARREMGGPPIGGKSLLLVKHLTSDSLASARALFLPDKLGSQGFQLGRDETPEDVTLCYNKAIANPKDLGETKFEHFELPADSPEAAEHITVVSAQIDERLLAIHNILRNRMPFYEAFPPPTR